MFKGKNIIFYLIALLLTQFSSIIFSILVREILKNTMPTFYLIFFLVCLISGRLISYIIERSAQTATNLKFENSISELEKYGINRDTILNHSIITPACGMGILSQQLSEKVAILTNELSERIINKMGK